MAKLETMITWTPETSDEARAKILAILDVFHGTASVKSFIASAMENLYLMGKLDGTREASKIAVNAIKQAVQS